MSEEFQNGTGPEDELSAAEDALRRIRSLRSYTAFLDRGELTLRLHLRDVDIFGLLPDIDQLLTQLEDMSISPVVDGEIVITILDDTDERDE